MRNGERVYFEKEISSGTCFKSFLLAIYILIVVILTIILVLMINTPKVVSEKIPFL